MATSKTRTRTVAVRPSTPSAVTPRGFKPAGDAAEQSLTSRRFQVPEGAGRVAVRRPIDGGGIFVDVSDGDGSGWIANPGGTRLWVTRVVDLPAVDPFDLQVGSKVWSGLTVAQIQRLGIPNTITIDPSVPEGAAPDSLMYSLAPTTGGATANFALALANFPRNATVAEVRASGETDVTRPGHWDGTSYIVDARPWSLPLNLLLRYPDGTSRAISGLDPMSDARFQANPSLLTVDAAAPPAATVVPLVPFVHIGGPHTNVALPTLGDGGTGSFGVPPPPPPGRGPTPYNSNSFGIMGNSAPALSRIEVAGIPDGGRIMVDGIDLSLAPGASWNATHTAYGVPVIVGPHSLEVVAPSGEKRGKPVTVGASPLSIEWATMPVTQAATGAGTGGPPAPPPVSSGRGAIAVNNLPRQVTPDDLTAIREDGTSATFATTGTDGRFIASELAPGVWQVRAVEQHAMSGSPGSNFAGQSEVVRSGTVTVRANETAELNFNDMVAVGGMAPRRDDTPVVDHNYGAVPFSLVAPANFAVSVDGQLLVPQSALTSGVMDGPYMPGGATHMDRFQTMLAPGTHRVSVRDASAAACYADTRDITVTAGVPASLDYSAPTTAALLACAGRTGASVTQTGQSGGGWWSRRSEGEKVGIVALALAVLGGGTWYYASTQSAKKVG